MRKGSGSTTAWTLAAYLKTQGPVQDPTQGLDGTRRPRSAQLFLGLGVGGIAIILKPGRSAGKGVEGRGCNNL